MFLHHVHCDYDMPCLPFLRGFDLRNVLLGFLRVRLLEHLFMRDQSAVRYCQGVVVSESRAGSRTHLEQLLDVLSVRVIRRRAFDTLPGVPEGR